MGSSGTGEEQAQEEVEEGEQEEHLGREELSNSRELFPADQVSDSLVDEVDEDDEEAVSPQEREQDDVLSIHPDPHARTDDGRKTDEKRILREWLSSTAHLIVLLFWCQLI